MRSLTGAIARLGAGGALTLSRAPEGFDAFVLAELARGLARAGETRAAALVFVARDGARAQSLIDALAFAAPEIEALYLPSWDCQPYDRVSPNAATSAARMTALARLARSRGAIERPRVLVVSVNGLTQRVPPLSFVTGAAFSASPGNSVRMDDLAQWLTDSAYTRVGVVRDVGDYAARGGILDLYPPGAPAPIRLDFFGDTLESIRAFDPETQLSIGQLRSLDLAPVSEARLTSETIRRFRQTYTAEFGAPPRGDALYEAVSEGRRAIGLEHWLPLFYERLDTLFDYVGDAPFVLDTRVEEVTKARFAQIEDYYSARRTALQEDPVKADYRPLPPDRLYLTADEFAASLARGGLARLAPFEGLPGDAHAVDCGGRVGRDFAPERLDENINVFDAVARHIATLRERGLKVVVAGWSDGSRDRLGHVLAEHGIKSQELVSSWPQAKDARANALPLAVIALERGFETDDLAIVGEQDMLGDRLVRASKRKRRAQDVLAEAAALTAGDLVVHIDHGVGRFIGLKTIEAAGAPHDCLELHYAGGDRLFLPVENLELLSRYGSEQGELDRLGSTGWQTRKSRLKKRVREMAGELIRIAAQRMTRSAPRLIPPEGLYDEFCARFPYDETQDQEGAIGATLDDLAAGRPMDRLVCGDVGFGKTEVALRAAFCAAINGKQTAIVAPTTLLARQHAKTFAARFAGLPIRVGQLSRMVGALEQRETKKGLVEGSIDIAIGTHALLGKNVSFKDLGLVVIDEEQHFGVGHKERLKELRAEVHVLTLSATPIPRTLQLAMSGVRELSIIATPPIDRLAVRSFVSPFDALIVREALLRERYRGGQSFYVCPRIDDLDEAAAFLRQNVPEAKFVVAHGQMAASELEDRIGAFYDGKYDILLSTSIVESGLDIPRANTLIVHRADMFGLAQLYQLRGRVGRAKARAYAIFTTPVGKPITPQAEKRLAVLQSLDTLGAGFQLASHDLDLRGAGNLLGEEQSGHIKEVGYELYQQMVQDAIERLKAGEDEPAQDMWSPTISLGSPVTIPESYIPDLTTRLGLYRRLSALAEDSEIDAMGAEIVDRFGPPPPEVALLIKLVSIKVLCRRAHVEKLEAGAKGVTLAFRDNSFADPSGLVRWVGAQGPNARVRPDMRIVVGGEFDDLADRLEGVLAIMREIARLADKAEAKKR
ncbi:MAG: transcription-repair coupling factor [Bradyrhizobium sp.]|nr:MAG: transcription-repair coupling factor [Bradyrhizobium sp.]